MPCNMLPLETIPVKDAITRVFNGTCHVVSEYDVRIRTANRDLDINWPAIIARNDSKNSKPRLAMTDDNLFYRDHGMCQYCEKKLEIRDFTEDHVIPKSMGGTTSWENIVIACSACNNRKDNKPPVGEFAPKRMPYKPTYNQLVNLRRKFPITVDTEAWIPFIGEWDAPIKIRGTDKVFH